MVHVSPTQRHCFSYTSNSPLKGNLSRDKHVSPTQRHCFHTHQLPSQGRFIQNCTCKSYLEALFLAYNSSPSKGNIQSHTCKAYLEALFHAYSSSLLKGDIKNHICKAYQELVFINTSKAFG